MDVRGFAAKSETQSFLVMASANPTMRNLTRLRQATGRLNTPLTGAIHSIHEDAMLRRVLIHVLLAGSRQLRRAHLPEQRGSKSYGPHTLIF